MVVARLRCGEEIFGSISYHWYYHIRSGKIQLCSAVPPTKSAQAISSIFSTKIQLGPNWQQSTTKMYLVQLRCDADSYNYFTSLMITFKFNKNIYLLCCTANQSGTGHNLHFQPKNLTRAKLEAINNNNGCGTAEVWCRQFRKYLISLILSYEARIKTALLRCTANQSGIGHNLHFQPKNLAWAKLAAINNKNGCGRAEV